MNEFAHTLNRFITASGKSISQIAELSGLDRSYLLRLTMGAKDNPSPSTVVRLFVALIADVAVIKRDPTLVHGLDELLLALAATSTGIRAGAK